MEGKKIQGDHIENHMPVRRLETPSKKFLFRLEPENAKTLTYKMIEMWRCIGVEHIEVSVYENETTGREGEAKVGASNLVKLEGSVKRDRGGKWIFGEEGSTPSNIVPSHYNIDREFIRKYGLETVVSQTCESYDAFVSGKSETLESREEVYSLDVTNDLSSSCSVGVSATHAGIDVTASASKMKQVESKMEFRVKLLSDKHEGLLSLRKTNVENTRKAEDEARKADDDQRRARDEADRQLELEATERRCKGDLDSMISTYQKEMNDALERLVGKSWFILSFFTDESATTDGTSGQHMSQVKKEIYIVGFREAGKSSLAWLMSTLGRRTWDTMDADPIAQTVRRPRGIAEASVLTSSIPLNVLLPSKKVATFAVDIQGEQTDPEGFIASSSNQLKILVTSAKQLFTRDGELVAKIEKNLNKFKVERDATAIVVTKWDELLYGSVSQPKELFRNVDAFWSNPDNVEFAHECLRKLQDKFGKRAFAIRMPIRDEECRSYQAKLQMCSGVRELMLYLLTQMK